MMLNDFNFHRVLGLKLYNFKVRYSESQTLFWAGRPFWHFWNHSSIQLISKIIHSLGQWSSKLSGMFIPGAVENIPLRGRKKILSPLSILILTGKKELTLSAQSCPTLCNPMDSSLPGSSVHGFLQVIILEWVAISYSSGSSQPRIEPTSTALAGGFFTPVPPGKPPYYTWS